MPDAKESQSWLTSLRAQFGETLNDHVGFGDEFYGLRALRDGEDLRGVHWKSSAKKGALLKRETQAFSAQNIEILFVNQLPSAASARDIHLFENGIKYTAGLLERLYEDGFEITFSTTSTHHALQDLKASELDASLRQLALVMPSHAANLSSTHSRKNLILIGFESVLHLSDHAEALTLSFEELDDD